MPSPRLDNAFIPRPPNFVKTGINIDWTSFDPTQPFTVPVNSSAISAIAHNPITETTEVDFQDGTTYEYYDIPTMLVIEWIQSSSIGRFFNYNIRDNFNYSQIG